jgi:hypothetical protein
MRNKNRIIITALALLLGAQAAFAQDSVFTYQGKLTDAGNPANGTYDIQFKLFDTADVGTGTQQGDTITNPTVQVSAGIFTVQLDFTATVFNGSPRYLEIAVRPAGSANPYTVLAPRQPVTSTPYAVRSLSTTTADALSVACVNCVTSSQIASVEGTQVTGAIPVESVPTGSGNYIQNAAPLQKAGKNSLQQAASFNVDGDGTSGGTLSGNVVNTTTQYNIGGNRVLSLGAGVGLGAALDNLFLGVSAGEGNTTGSQNSFFGRASGIGNTTGLDNSAFGAYSGGQVNMTGSANSFFGVSAGFNTSTGSANMFFGRSAGFQNTTGLDNSFFGVQAGRDSSTGSQNSFFGRASGIGNTSGFDNSYFGAYTGQAVTTGSANSFFGVSAGFNNRASANSFFGRSAGFQNTTGADNSFFGTQAGRDNSTGGQNSFFGRSAGISSTTGIDNTFVGAFAGQGNLGGDANSFFGVSAGFNNTSDGNAFFGRSAGFQNTTGFSNSFFGTQAGRDNSTGVDNSFFGRVAGLGNLTGSNNTIIGSNANVGAGNLFNATAIGANALVSQSNALILGSSNVSVGIGTSAPTAKLHVVGTAMMNVLELTGGLDLAEHFEIAGGGKPGLVVAIDPHNTGRFSIARGAYNRRVAGIISGANNLAAGMVLSGGKHSKESMPIALSGRVWVYCDATKHAIRPGDLLTTSNFAGHAMKVSNYTRAQGAVIGKAMTALKSGRGLVLVLVTLQ